MNRVLISFAFLCCFMVAEAQQMDTILFFDYYNETQYSLNKRSFLSDGLTIFFNNKDSLKLIATDSSTRLNFKWRNPYPIYRSNEIVIEGIRIIKPHDLDYSLRFKSGKVWYKRKFYLDTLFNLRQGLPMPYIFWQPLREKGFNLAERFHPTQFVLANYEFAYKKTYQKPDLIQKLNAAIRYEYYLPEGKLVKLW
jgi:hypothetical protein